MTAPLSTYAAQAPTEMVLSDGMNSYSRQELDRLVEKLRYDFVSWGLNPDDRVALLARNSADYLVTVIAATLGQISIVPVNTHLTPVEIAEVLRVAKPVVALADAENETKLSDALQADASVVQKSLPSVLAEAGRNDDHVAVPATGVAGPIYITSGTTGLPKATRMADVPHGVSVAEAVEEARVRGYDRTQVQLTVGPLYHAGPLGEATRALLGGSRVVVMSHFDPEEMLRLVELHAVTMTKIVPTHCVRLLSLPDETKRSYDSSSLRRVVHTAAMMPPQVKRDMIDWWGPILEEGYGSSEVGFVTRITSEEWLQRPGSVGRAVPGFSLAIYDGDTELPSGQIGQIYITSHTDLDLHYIDDPVRTAAAHRAAKQFTIGDVGYLDDAGYLYLADRRADLIISGGVNVYPAEVENAISECDEVADVGVFGLPHPEWGHEVCAAIALAPDVISSRQTADRIRGRLRESLASYKIPRRLYFLDQLPRYDTGKLHRRELRTRDWDHETVF